MTAQNTQMLPKVASPVYSEYLPSDNRLIEFESFKVRQLRALQMIASEDDTAKRRRQIISTLKQIVRTSVITEGVDVDKLPTIDLEFLFLKLFVIASGEPIQKRYFEFSKECGREDEDGNPIECSCQNRKAVEIDFGNLTIKRDESHNNKVHMKSVDGQQLTLVLGYPTFDDLSNMKEDDPDSDLRITAKCVREFWVGEEHLDLTQVSTQTLVDFIADLPKDEFEKINNFFSTAPKISEEIHIECEECGRKDTFNLEGLEGFFEFVSREKI